MGVIFGDWDHLKAYLNIIGHNKLNKLNRNQSQIQFKCLAIYLLLLKEKYINKIFLTHNRYTKSEFDDGLMPN